MHWCVQVDDVEEALARVEALGATTVQPLGDWGGSKFVYCYDLDGNVFEMLESSMEDIARLTIDLFPEAKPPRPSSNVLSGGRLVGPRRPSRRQSARIPRQAGVPPSITMHVPLIIAAPSLAR